MQSLDGSVPSMLEGQPPTQMQIAPATGSAAEFIVNLWRPPPVTTEHPTTKPTTSPQIAPTNLSQPIANRPPNTIARGGKHHLVPCYHSTDYATAVHRSSVFPDGQHVAHPVIRTTTNVQPILIPLPRRVPPNNAVAKSQQSRHTSARDGLTYYRVGVFTVRFFRLLAQIEVKPQSYNGRSPPGPPCTFQKGSTEQKPPPKSMTGGKIKTPHTNNPGGEGRDSNNITTPETSRIVKINTKRGSIPLSLPMCRRTTKDQITEKEETTGHKHEVPQLDQKCKGEIAKAGTTRIGNYPRMEDDDRRPTITVRVHN
ncbi:unnamed protein product [Lactuca virosa]|uniref:Uncharacterized protein n=1 Tax=Lactuca virosa TaxID=75947 RepID=A0AAU9P3T6_9ASTR|nr:unnamed protein product [Lactuca virosa]